MGIFSFFGKKDERPTDVPAAKNPTQNDSAAEKGRESSAVRAQTQQRKAARATAAKIDAIESEMSSEFVNTLSAKPSISTAKSAAAEKHPASSSNKPKASKSPAFQTTLPMGNSTDFLLSAGTTVGNAIAANESAPVVEEAAILYANGQIDMVEQVLREAIAQDALGSATLSVWRMLFELYQLTGKCEQYEALSIDFASKFETSPPSWIETAHERTAVQAEPPPKSVPTVPFSGRLDGTIVKLLERAQKLAELSKVLRLEFIRVTEVDAVGCGILLSVLKKLQKSGHELILVGALDLVNKIRSILEVGRRDETEAPWLLIMEVLRLLNLEKDFEEVSIDYCVTFEVSPPAFVAPKNKVTTAMDEIQSLEPESDFFMMPTVIDGRTDQLIQRISLYTAEHNPAIIDCSRLTRVDFGASAQLLTGLAPLAGAGNVIEFQAVNQLVAALFNTMGLKDIVRIVPRKI